MHHAGSNPMHKWYARQGPGGAASDAPTTLAPTRGTGSPPVPSDDGGDDDNDTGDDSSSTTETSRTRTTPSSSSSTTPPSTSSTRSSTTSTTPETSDPVVTTTVQSTSTSTSFSSESTTTSESETTTEEETTEAPTTALTTPTTSATRTLVTSFVTASASIPTLASSATNSLASSGSGSDSSGPSAGTVVGIVAGALVGVVVLSGIIGYVFRTKCNNKNDEDDFDGENPFGNMDDGFGGRAGASRAELRRDSQLLGGEDGDSIHQMSEMGHAGSYGNLAAAAGAGAGAGAAGAYALNRGNSTSLPGLQRQDTVNPRPPTMIQRHYANMHAGGAQTYPDMPSFQPGQLVYPSSTMNQSSPYPTFQPGGASSVPIGGVFPSSASGHGHDQQYGQQQHFQDYTTNQDYGRQESDMPARTGTPEYANPQQYFHQASESFSSGTGMNPSPFGDHNAPAAGGMQQYTAQHQPQNAEYLSSDNSYPQGATPREKAMSGNERAKRTLSVRNGGAYDEDGVLRESVYGGM